MSIDQLIEAARAAARRAYAPYSGFAVGAAALGEDGAVYAGCNVENASYGLTVCAERAAIFNAVSHGCRRFQVLAIYTPTPEPTPPCGACRQVLAEFSPDMQIVCACDGPGRLKASLSTLLPSSFAVKHNEAGVVAVLE